MSKRLSQKRNVTRFGVILGFPLLLLGACISAEVVALKSARPPTTVKTIQDFRAWKGKSIMGEREYRNSGTNYTVMLAPAGRLGASGPSAYLFDRNGEFIDWTADMGDFETKKYKFDLSGGRVKRAKGESR
jgi:hypothetical protein